MPLPGKLAIGFLEEDNPIKGYFRFQPVRVLEDGTFSSLEDIAEKYPEEGFIRIVPDKNEIATFKSRMRQLGGYCALDLRRYPLENEKIRPNKNYGLSSERNASIVYSDVIIRTPSELAVQVVDAQYVFPGEEVTLRTEAPGTSYVLIRREGQLMGPWSWSADQDVSGCIALRHAAGIEFRSIPEEEVRGALLTLTGERGSVMLMTEPERFGIMAQAAVPQPVAPQAVVPQPVAHQAAVSQATEPQEAPKEPCADPGEKEGSAEPLPEAPRAEEAAATHAHEEAAPPKEEAPRSREEKVPAREEAPRPVPPQEHKADERVEAARKLRAVAGRLSLRDQAIVAQSGINPRRGRSLSEVVDDQWRKSRYEQLGHPVPPEASGRPVLSPIDRAAEAVKEAWAIEDARSGLLRALLGEEDLRDALMETLNIHAQSQSLPESERMAELEAEKLKLMSEIDALRIRRADMKSELMEELRRSHQREFDALTARDRKIREEIERDEATAKAAREAAGAAQKQLSDASNKMLGHMMEQAAALRAAKEALEGTQRAPLEPPKLYEPTAGELLSDVRVRLEEAGFSLDNDQAINLMLVLRTGGLLVVSGPAGSGKSRLSRCLAGALGLTSENGRYLEIESAFDERARAFIDGADGLTPSVLLLDDFNVPGDTRSLEEAVRLGDRARERSVTIVLTAQDAPEGTPLSARLLGRAFFLRLEIPSPDQPWKPAPQEQPAAEKSVSLDTLRKLFAPSGEMPMSIEARLGRLRAGLEAVGVRLDLRTLSDMWSYCASMAAVSHTGDMETLDRAIYCRALPALLAGMNLDQLIKLPELLCDMPCCMALLDKPLPLPSL